MWSEVWESVQLGIKLLHQDRGCQQLSGVCKAAVSSLNYNSVHLGKSPAALIILLF